MIVRYLACLVLSCLLVCIMLAGSEYICPALADVAAPAKTAINPKDGAEMLLIPAGDFLMGCTGAEKPSFDNELPQRTIMLDAYYIYKNDVTVGQYRKFCEATNRPMPKPPSFGWHDDHPMIIVSWDDATAYAQWASASLPTEAQWEKAARGTDGRLFPWGNEWDAAKCQCSKGGVIASGTAPAGSFPTGASPYGVMDMVGNVSQWCADWYDDSYYQHTDAKNPTGPKDGTTRAVRGSAWLDADARNWNLRVTHRSQANPATPSGRIGFRCVVLPATLTPQPAPGTTIAPVDTTATLKLTTNPPGATVLLDGVPQQQTTNCTLTIQLGVAKAKTVEVGLTLAGYQDEVYKITIERGKTLSGTITLKKKIEPAPPSMTPETAPPKTVEPAAKYFLQPVSTSKNDFSARLISVKDSLFFIDSSCIDGRVIVQFDDFLLPNAKYAKLTFNWSKLLNTDNLNIIRPPTEKELKEDTAHQAYGIYCKHDKAFLDSAVGTVQMRVPLAFAHVSFGAKDLNIQRQDGRLSTTMVNWEDGSVDLKFQGKVAIDDLVFIAYDALGTEVEKAEVRQNEDDASVYSVSFWGSIVRLDVYLGTEHLTGSYDIVASSPPDVFGKEAGPVKVTRYAVDGPALKSGDFTPETLKAQVKVTAVSETTSEENCPIVRLSLPQVLNSAYAMVDFGMPQLTDAKGNAVAYDPSYSYFDLARFTSDVQFTETKTPFAFATGSMKVRYPLKLTETILTIQQPTSGNLTAQFNGPIVKVKVPYLDKSYDLPEYLRNVRAFDATGRLLMPLERDGNDDEYAFWGKPVKVCVLTVDKWVTLDFPYHLPPAPKQPEK